MDTHAPATIDQDKLNAFMGKMAGDMSTAMSGALVLIGDRLGLYCPRRPERPTTHRARAEALLARDFVLQYERGINHAYHDDVDDIWGAMWKASARSARWPRASIPISARPSGATSTTTTAPSPRRPDCM